MGSPNIIELEAAIENAVRARQLGLSRRLIKSYVKARGGTPDARLKASEFFRRLTDYGPALKVLHSEALGASQRAGSTVAQNQLQLARILNLLGASGYALRILATIAPADRLRHRPQVAGILLSNYRYAEAVPLFADLENTSTSRCAYADRLQKINLADAWFGVGRVDDALALAIEIERTSSEPLLKGIAHQVAASYLVISRRLKAVPRHLDEAQRHFPESDTTADRGFLDKWIAAYWIERGQREKAKRPLAAAWKTLYRAGIKPEGWLELEYLEGLARRAGRSRSLPREWLRILAYPAPVPSRVVAWIAERAEIDGRHELAFSARRRAGRRTLIDLSDDTKCGPSGRQSLGLTVVDQLAAALVVAGSRGLPQFRAYEALWPDERFAFAPHQKRMEQVALRLRKDGHDLRWKNHHLALESDPAIRVRWSVEPGIPGESFLRAHGEFDRGDVAREYALSPRAASYAIRRWVEAGAIEAIGRGRYRTKGRDQI